MADLTIIKESIVEELDELVQADFTIEGEDNAEAERINRASITFWEDVWRRFRKNRVALFAGILFLLIALLTVIGPYIAKHSFTTINLKEIHQLPNAKHWFGTDEMGRDIFARVWVGGRVSIAIAITCTFVMAIIGSLYGGVAGYYGGGVDTVMMRIIEIMSSIPTLIVTILITLIIGRTMTSLIIAMTAFSWQSTARLIRGQILQLKEQEFVLAAGALGASPVRVILKHLLPNALGVLMVDITFSVPGFIFGEAFLSYIGIGIQAPNTSWGALASAAQTQLMFYPHMLFFPCLMISLVMLSFNLLGDGLNDALDPQLRQ